MSFLTSQPVVASHVNQVLSYHVIPHKSLKVDDINDGEEEETLLAKYYLTFHKE